MKKIEKEEHSQGLIFDWRKKKNRICNQIQKI